VKTVRDDGTAIFGVGVVSYDRDPTKPFTVTSDNSIFSIDGRDHLADEDAVIMRLKMMIRDCESHPIYVVKG
jgi:hypothetical protein